MTPRRPSDPEAPWQNTAEVFPQFYCEDFWHRPLLFAAAGTDRRNDTARYNKLTAGSTSVVVAAAYACSTVAGSGTFFSPNDSFPN